MNTQELKIAENTKGEKQFLIRKILLGLAFGFLLAIVILNVDKKLWLPLELETINGRNNSSWLKQTSHTKENIVVILFDDKTQFLLRQGGMPIKDFERKGRDLLRVAIEKLESSNVKAIGVNLNLNTPSEPKQDELLVNTISKYKNIVLVDSIHSFPSGTTNIGIKSTQSVGYGELYADYDSIVHRIKLLEKGYKDLPSFSYALFMLSSGKDVDVNLKTRNEFYLKYPLNFSIPKFSFIDLIQDKIASDNLKDKIVILGIGLKGKLMLYKLLNPFKRELLLSDSEVQAVALSNLLTNNYLYKFSLNNYPFLYILLSLLLGALLSGLPTLRRLIISTFLFILLLVICQIAYNYFQTIIELVPIVFLLLGNLVIGSLIYLQLNLHKQNLELTNTLEMLKKRSYELEVSQLKLEENNKHLTGALSELNKKIIELKEVRKKLSTKSEEERKRIARELHDDTLSRITDLKRYIESLTINEEAKQKLLVSIKTLDDVTSEIRRIINALRPSMLDNVLGLIPAIESLLDELSKRSNYKIQTKLKTSIVDLSLDEVNEINLYRIIQEALNNIFKHSGANKAEVSLEKQPGQLLILVTDNGVGFKQDFNESKQKRGYGLLDIRERADLIGATVQFLNKPGDSGTTVEITIPEEKILSVKFLPLVKKDSIVKV